MTTGDSLDQQALTDILNGACILGSGGGGPYVVGQELVKDLLTMGPVTVVSPDPQHVPDQAFMAVSAAAGSPDAAGNGAFPCDVATAAYGGLEKLLGRTFTHVLAGEVGAGNSFIPMIPAAKSGLPLVDASGSPRAIPMLTQCTFADLPTAPVMVADTETQISYNAPSTAVADSALRGIVGSGDFPDFAGVALWAMDGSTMRSHALPGTLSRAQAVGVALRNALASGQDPVKAVCGSLPNARVLFQGGNLQFTESSGGGFDVGTVTLDSGSARLIIYNQNENLIAWICGSNRPLAMAPDLICYLTTDGQPFSNATPDIVTFAQGKKVAVIGVPAAGLGFATPPIIAAFAPLLTQLGYPGPFVPLSDAVAES